MFPQVVGDIDTWHLSNGFRARRFNIWSEDCHNCAARANCRWSHSCKRSLGSTRTKFGYCDSRLICSNKKKRFWSDVTVIDGLVLSKAFRKYHFFVNKNSTVFNRIILLTRKNNIVLLTWILLYFPYHTNAKRSIERILSDCCFATYSTSIIMKIGYPQGNAVSLKVTLCNQYVTLIRTSS